MLYNHITILLMILTIISIINHMKINSNNIPSQNIKYHKSHKFKIITVSRNKKKMFKFRLNRDLSISNKLN
jgi:hypothetical protein